MPDANVTVEQWVEMFRAIGLQDADMHKWHEEFERRFPQGHENFLRWLGLPVERIAEVRRQSSSGGF